MNRSIPSSAFKRLGSAALAWLATWWNILLFGVVIVALALSPSTYDRSRRRLIAHHIVRAALPNLLWFTVLSALVGVVLIRIVVVTALSYGLSRFAIEMVVRVLVLELIPLTAALFIALRHMLPEAALVGQMRAAGVLLGLRQRGVDPVRQEFLPRVLAGVFSVWMLGTVSCIMTLVLAYLAIYGFTPWAVAMYTRVVGQVFNSAVNLILVLKLFFFSLAVSFIPMASAYSAGAASDVRQRRRRGASGQAGVVRLFSAVLLIEVASLMGNYY